MSATVTRGHTCTGCGVSWARCTALRAGRCCLTCLSQGTAHTRTRAGEVPDESRTTEMPTPMAKTDTLPRATVPDDPPTDPPFYVATVQQQGTVPLPAAARRPSPTPRTAPLEPLPNPPIYAELAAELLIDPLPPTYARSSRA